MENTAANDNMDFIEDGYFIGGSYYTEEQYRFELSSDIEIHPAETMFHSTDQELDDFIKSGSFEQRRYAKIEKCDRMFNIGLEDIAGCKTDNLDPELEKVLCEIEASWKKEV